MKYLLSFISFTIMFCSCDKTSEGDLKNVPVKYYFAGIQILLDNAPTAEQYDDLHSVTIINSLEELKCVFNRWNLKIPYGPETEDYEKYTFLLRFYIYGNPYVKHSLIFNKMENEYLYYLTFNSNDPEFSSYNFYYTGILVDKINKSQKIKALTVFSSW